MFSVFVEGAYNQKEHADLLAKLVELKPLPKIHYSWHIERRSRLLEKESLDFAYQLARITHALSVCGEYVEEAQIEKCVYICAKVNKTNPSIKASLGVNFNPWQRKFPKGAPPTQKGLGHDAEIKFFVERMRNIKAWADKANQKYGTKVKIGCLLLDSERFYAKAGESAWNEAIREKLDIIHIKTREIFPDAKIQWYGRGITRPDGQTWRGTGLWTGKEIKSAMSCSLYLLSEQEAMRETYRRTCKLADSYGIEEVTPYVALASGYRRHITKKLIWTYDIDYDLNYSWQMGAELNHPWYSERPSIYAPYDRAKIIVFYPSPFYSEVPSWPKHFIAYVRGASSIKKLDDIEKFK